MTGPSDNREQPLTLAQVGRSGVAPAEAFLVKLESNAEAGWLAKHVLDLMLSAFAARDTQFPNPGCSTLVHEGSRRLVEGADEFAVAANELVRTGALGVDQLEIVARLGFLEISKQGASGAAQISDYARTLLWLEANSKLPVLTFATTSIASNELTILAPSMANLLRDSGSRAPDPPLSRGEKYVAVAWLGSLEQRLLELPEIVPALPNKRTGKDWVLPPDVANHSSPTLVGKIAAVPRGPLGTALTAISGWMLARIIFTGMCRLFLAYRTRAEVRVTHEGLQIREQKSLLGRKFRENSSLITLDNVRRLSREIRYARAGTYAGIAALAIGSFLGMRLFVDGLRVPGTSFALLWLGLAAVVGGLALDFLLANWLDASRGQCRLVVVTERGRGLCLAGVEPAEVDTVLSALAQELGKRT